MNETKHSGGDWTASGDSICTMENGRHVCIGLALKSEEISRDEMLVNGRLMAAAPEMLAALLEMVGTAPGFVEWAATTGSRGGPIFDGVMTRARAAISKATAGVAQTATTTPSA